MPLERMSKYKFGRMWKNVFQDSIDKDIKSGNLKPEQAPDIMNDISDLQAFELMIEKFPQWRDKYDFYDPAENEEMLTAGKLAYLGVRDFGIGTRKGILSLLEAGAEIAGSTTIHKEKPKQDKYFRNKRDEVDAWAERVATTDPLIRAYTEWQGEKGLALDDVFTKRSIPAITQGFMSMVPVFGAAGIGGQVGAYSAAWLMQMGSSVERIAEQLESEGWEYDDALDMSIIGGAMTATMVAYLEQAVPMAVMKGKTVKGLTRALPAKFAKSLKQLGMDANGVKGAFNLHMPSYVKGIASFIGHGTEEALTEGIQQIWEEAIASSFSGPEEMTYTLKKFGKGLANTPWPEVAMAAYAGFWAGGAGSSMIDGMSSAYGKFQEQKLAQPEALNKWVDKYLDSPLIESANMMIASQEEFAKKPGGSPAAAQQNIQIIQRGTLEVFRKAAPNQEIAKRAILLAREKLGWIESTTESDRVNAGKTYYTKVNPDGSIAGESEAQSVANADLRKYTNPDFRTSLAAMGSSRQEDVLNLIEKNGLSVVQQLETGQINGQTITPEEMSLAIDTIGSAITGKSIVDSNGKPLNLLNEAGNFDANKVIGATKFLVGNDVRIIREAQELGGQAPIALNLSANQSMIDQLINSPENFKNMPMDYEQIATDPRLQATPISSQDAASLASIQSVAPETVLPSPQELATQPSTTPSPEEILTNPEAYLQSPQAIFDDMIEQEIRKQAEADNAKRAKGNKEVAIPTEATPVTKPIESKPEKPQELTNEQQDLFSIERKQIRTGRKISRDLSRFGYTYSKELTVANTEIEQSRARNYEKKLTDIVNKYSDGVDVKFIPRESTTPNFDKDSPYDEMSGSYSEKMIKFVHGLAGDDTAYHEVGHYWLSRVLSADEYAEVLSLAWKQSGGIVPEITDEYGNPEVVPVEPKDIPNLNREALILLEETAADAAKAYLEGRSTFTGRLRDLLRRFWFKIRQMFDSKFTDDETLEQYFMRIGAEQETRQIDNISEILMMQGQGESIPLDLAATLFPDDERTATRKRLDEEAAFAKTITENATWVAAKVFKVPSRPYKPMEGSKTNAKIKNAIKVLSVQPKAKPEGITDFAPVILTKLSLEDVLRKMTTNLNVFKPLQVSNKIRISPLEQAVFDSFMAEVKELAKAKLINAKINPAELADRYREFVETLYPLYEIASNTESNQRNRNGLGYGFKQVFSKNWYEANANKYDFKFTEVSITDDQWSSMHSYYADESTFIEGNVKLHPFGWYIYGTITNKETGEDETVIYEHQRDVDPGDKRAVNLKTNGAPDWRTGNRPISTKEDLAATLLADRLFFPGYMPVAKAAHKFAHHIKQRFGLQYHGEGAVEMLNETVSDFFNHEVLGTLTREVDNTRHMLNIANFKIALYHILDNSFTNIEGKKNFSKAIDSAIKDIEYDNNLDNNKYAEINPPSIQGLKTTKEILDVYIPWVKSALKTIVSKNINVGSNVFDSQIDNLIDLLDRNGAFYTLVHNDYTPVTRLEPGQLPNGLKHRVFIKVHIDPGFYEALGTLLSEFAYPQPAHTVNAGAFDNPNIREIPETPNIKILARNKVVMLNILKKALRKKAKANRQAARFKNPKYAEAFVTYAIENYNRLLAYVNGELGLTKTKSDLRISDDAYVGGIADSWMAKSIRHSIYKAKAEGKTTIWMPTMKSHVQIEGDYDEGIKAALLYRVAEEKNRTKKYFKYLYNKEATEDQLIGPFYINLVGIKGVRILSFEKPSWSKHEMLKVDISNVKVEPIERFQTRRFMAGRDVRNEIETLKAGFSNFVMRNKSRNIDYVMVQRPDGEVARSMLFDALSEMMVSKKKAYNFWIESKTERFIDWFGNSPIVDRNGEPIPMWFANSTGESYTFSNQNTKGEKVPFFIRGEVEISKAGDVTVASASQFINVNDTKFLPPKDNVKVVPRDDQSDDDEKNLPSLVDAKSLNFDFREIGEAHSKRNFIREMGMYMTDEQYAQTATHAVSAASYEEFKESFEKYAREIGAKENFTMEEGLGRSFWQRMKNRTFRRSAEHPEGRITFEMIFLSKEQQALTGQDFVILPSGSMRKTEGSLPANIKTGRQLPDTFTTSFPEAQGIRYGVISTKEIAQQRSKISQRPNEGGVGSANVMENFYFDYQFSLNPTWVEMIDKKFMGMAMKYQDQPLYFFFAPRAGDASQLIIGEVNKDLEGLTRAEFNEILADEINRKGTMTRQHALNLLASADKRAQWDTVLRRNNGNTVVKNPHAYAQILSWHRMAQMVAGSHYLMEQVTGKPNVQDWFNRLRISFNDGIVPINTGESSMWFMNTEDVHFQVNGRRIEHRRLVKDLSGNIHDEGYGYDGFLFTGSAKLATITKAVGKLDYIVKSFIRDVKMNPDGTPSRDMIGLKMLEGTPHPQMSIHDNQSGRKLAGVITDSEGETLWQLYDIDGNPTEQVESVGSLDERKQGYGETYGALQKRIVVPEHARRIKFLGGAAKRTAAHPVKMDELILDNKFLEQSLAGREYLEAKDAYVEEMAKDYSDMLLGFRENPIELLNFIKSDLQEGELPTEVQMYVQLIDNAIKEAKARNQPNAESIAGAMFHGNIASQILPMLNNAFFSEGLYQMRQIKKGQGTKVVLKPAIDLQLNDEEFAISIQNNTVLNLVEQAYLDQGHKKIWAPEDFTGKVNLLNDWLARNPLDFIIHRQPIQQPSSVRVYKLKKIVWGKHGQSAFFNMHNVFHVHEGDHDGDTVFIERPSSANGMAMMSKLKALMNDEHYLKRIRTLEFKIFDFHRTASDLSSEADRMMATASNAVAVGAQGMIVNAKTALAVMGYKDIRLQTVADKGTRKAIYARKPTDTVYPTYLRVDAKMDKYIYDRLNAEGDAVVYFTNGQEVVAPFENLEAVSQQLEANGQRLFYRTSAENEFSILLQMAVDNPKYGYLGLIGFGADSDPIGFLVERMFYRLDEQGNYEDLTKSEVNMLKNLYAQFRYSAMRHGKDEFGNRQKISDSYDSSQELSNLYLKEDGTALPASTISDIMMRRVQALTNKYAEDILAISMNNKITLTEKLLMSVNQNWRKHFSEPHRAGRYTDIVDPVTYRLGSYQYAHIHAMNDIKGRYIKDLTTLLHKGSPAVVTDMERGRAMSQEAGTEFYRLLEERNNKSPANRRSDAIQAIRFEFNKEFADFTDKWYGKISDELGQAGRINFSLWFLNGIEMLNLKNEQTKIDKVTKLLPLPLMNEMVLSHYLQAYSRHILSPVKNMNNLGELANFGLPFREINEWVRDNVCG